MSSEKAKMMKAFVFIGKTFNNPRSLRPVWKTRARKTHLWWRRVRSGNPYANWVHTSPWCSMGC